MTVIEILLIISALVGLSAGVPQLKQLIRVKQSDEFSLKTWLMWVGTQSVSVAYAFSLGDPLLTTINGIWAAFYFSMAMLIIYYSPKSRARREAKLLVATPVPEPTKL